MKYQRRLKTISKINTPQVNIFALGTDTMGSNFGKNEVKLNNGYPTDSISKEWYGDTSVENPDTYPGYLRPASTVNTASTGNNNAGNNTQKDNRELANGIMTASGTLNQLIGNTLNQASIKDPEAMKDSYRAQLGGLDTSSFDALNASKKANIANVSASDFYNMSNGAAVLNGISAGDVGATAGNAIVPGWGALIGGVLGTGSSIIGSAIGRRKARKQVDKMNKFIKEINDLNNKNYVIQNNNIAANNARMLDAAYMAEGGFLNMGNNIYESGGNMYYAPSLGYQNSVSTQPYAYGGQMGKHSNDFSNGLISIDNGGSHEMNPNQGVQMGVDNQGTPNLVEEGETVFGDFVFSNRITVPKDVLSSFGIKSKKKMTYADVSKYLAKESEERPNDQISQKGLERNLGLLSDAQEKQKMQKDAEEKMLQALNAVDPNMPADPMMAMQGEEQLQEDQMAQDQMAREQAMQEQAMQEQAMQEQMMQEQAMQEQMAQQEGQPTMAANGGFLKNCYAEGTNTKNTVNEKDIHYSYPRYGSNDSFVPEMYNYGVVTPTTPDSFFFRPFPNGYTAPYSDSPDLIEDYGWTDPSYKAATETPNSGIDWSATVAKNAAGFVPIVGTAIDAYDMIQNPSWYNATSLGLSAVGDLAYAAGPFTGGFTIPAAQVAKAAALARRARKMLTGSSGRVRLNKKYRDLHLKVPRTNMPELVENDSIEYTLPQPSFIGTPVDATRQYTVHPTDYTDVNIKAQGGKMNSQKSKYAIIDEKELTQKLQAIVNQSYSIPDFYGALTAIYGSPASDGTIHIPKFSPQDYDKFGKLYKKMTDQAAKYRRVKGTQANIDKAIYENTIADIRDTYEAQLKSYEEKIKELQAGRPLSNKNKSTNNTPRRSKRAPREIIISPDSPLQPQPTLEEPVINLPPYQKEGAMPKEDVPTYIEDFELSPMESLIEYIPDFELESQPRMWAPSMLEPAEIKLPPVQDFPKKEGSFEDYAPRLSRQYLTEHAPEYEIDEDRWAAAGHMKPIYDLEAQLNQYVIPDYTPAPIDFEGLSKIKLASPKAPTYDYAEQELKKLQAKHAQPGWIVPDYNPDHHMIEYYNEPKNQTEYYITPYPESYKDNPNDYFNDDQQVIIDPVNGIVTNFGYSKNLMDNYQGSREAGNTDYHYKTDESLLEDPDFIKALRMAGVDAGSIRDLEKNPTYKHLTAAIRANPEKWAPFLWSIKLHSGATDEALDFFNPDGSINYGKFERNFDEQFRRIRFDGKGGIAHWVLGMLKPAMVKKGRQTAQPLTPVAEEAKPEESEEQSKGTKLDEKKGEFLRYAGLLGDAGAFALSALSKPNYDNVDDYFKTLKGAYMPIDYNPIGGYLPYKPTDVNKMINDYNASTNATRRSLMDVHAGNRGSLSGALTMLNNGHLTNIGNAYIAANNANWEMLKDKEKFNRETSQINTENFLKAASSNQSALASLQNSLYNAYKWKDDIYQKNKLAKVQAYNNIFSDLTEIGTDIMNANDNIRVINAGGYGNGAQQIMAKSKDYKKDQNADGTWADNTYMNTNQQLSSKKKKNNKNK